ncbi:MAG: NAD-dependent epimerase/dehydratase family protein, partial [Acidimicrobiia bacterium]|nr:NAD-dependent epimerase/dehydratase family protein [Acidimicrobiia bacterium]
MSDVVEHDDRARPDVAVVTGAAGWLGQNLVRALVGTRDRIRVLVRTDTDAARLEVLDRAVDPVVGDLLDPVVVDRLFDGVAGASVFHLAGVIHPAARVRELYDVNVGGTQLVLDRARRAGAGRLMHVSSNSPFGANARPTDRFTETSPYHPYLAYGRSKMEAEQLVFRTQGRGDLEATIVRAPWFYGPFQPERQTTWFAAVRRGRFPLVATAPSNGRWRSRPTSSTACYGPRSPPPRRVGRGGSPTPSPTSSATSSPRCAPHWPPKASPCPAASPASPAWPAWWPSGSTAPCSRPGVTAGCPRARRAEGHHRLRRLRQPGR